MKKFDDLDFVDVERLKRRAVKAVLNIADSVEVKIQLVEDFEYVPEEEAKLATHIIAGLKLIIKYIDAEIAMVNDPKVKMSLKGERVRLLEWIPMMETVRDKPKKRIMDEIDNLQAFLLSIKDRRAPPKAKSKKAA